MLDAALTATTWQGRIFGPNVAASRSAHGDVVRQRQQYRFDGGHHPPRLSYSARITRGTTGEPGGLPDPDLPNWIREHHRRLLCAALTILSAFCKAGRPAQRLKPWGSYEGWSALIRGAIVWLGLPDPEGAREELVAKLRQRGEQPPRPTCGMDGATGSPRRKASQQWGH